MRKKDESPRKLIKDIKKANKDPEFRKGIREFIRYHTGKSS